MNNIIIERDGVETRLYIEDGEFTESDPNRNAPIDVHPGKSAFDLRPREPLEFTLTVTRGTIEHWEPWVFRGPFTLRIAIEGGRSIVYRQCRYTYHNLRSWPLRLDCTFATRWVEQDA